MCTRRPNTTGTRRRGTRSCTCSTAPAAATPGGGRGQSGAFEEVVLQDLIPAIDATYRTLPDRSHRALAGLSMGGGQALQIGLTHLDQFAWIGSFSSPLRGGLDLKTAYGGAFADAEAFGKRVRDRKSTRL